MILPHDSTELIIYICNSVPNQEQLGNAHGSLSSICSGSPNQCNDNDGKSDTSFIS